ncbi:putative mitochondrial protein, partial [Mucuna pruriens]
MVGREFEVHVGSLEGEVIMHQVIKNVNFLGHVILAEGIVMDPAKVEIVLQWERSKTAIKIRSFVGLVEYYQRFIEGFQELKKS